MKTKIVKETTTAEGIKARFSRLNPRVAEILERAELDGYGVIAEIMYSQFGNFLMDVECDYSPRKYRLVRVTCSNQLTCAA